MFFSCLTLGVYKYRICIWLVWLSLLSVFSTCGSLSLFLSLSYAGECLSLDPSSRPTVDAITAQLYGIADQLGEDMEQPSVSELHHLAFQLHVLYSSSVLLLKSDLVALATGNSSQAGMFTFTV